MTAQTQTIVTRKINQSLIKRLTEIVICPQRYYREEVTKEFARRTSDAMLKGQYAEYRAFGTIPKDGIIPVLPVHKKTGKPLTDQIRIDAQVQRLHEVMKQLNMKTAKTDLYTEVMVGNVMFHGTQDVLMDWNGRPYIMDLKFTGDVTSDYGKFAWGKFTKKHPMFAGQKFEGGGIYIADFDKQAIERGDEMDVIQAHAYMLIMEMITGRPWGFVYSVWDYKKNPEWKIIEVPFSREARQDTIQRLGETDHKLSLFESTNYAPEPSLKECVGCPVQDCPVRRLPEVESQAQADNTEIVFNDNISDDPFS